MLVSCVRPSQMKTFGHTLELTGLFAQLRTNAEQKTPTHATAYC